MAGTREILDDADTNWVKVPYQVVLGDSFTSLKDSVAYVAAKWGGYANTTVQQETMQRLDDLENSIGVSDMAVTGHPFFKDTRVGANDAINCVWQFNRDDDIVHPAFQSTGSDVGIGEGRVYANTTEQNQQICYFTFGVPQYTQLAEFYKNAFDKDVARMNVSGGVGTNTMLERIGSIFGAVGALAFAWPLLTVKLLHNICQFFQNYSVNRFYELRTTMHMYYEFVDSILAEWIVDVGFYGMGKSEGQANGVGGTWTADPNSLPISLRATGPSIWHILSLKARVLGFEDFGRNKMESQTTDVLAETFKTFLSMSAKEYDEGDGDAGKWNGAPKNNSAWDFIKDTACGATQYIGFRVEKDTDASESYSNSSAPSQVAQKINSTLQEKYQTAKMTGQAEGMNSGMGIIDGLGSILRGLVDSVAEVFDAGDITDAAFTGTLVDIPEEYQSSDFNKSHSLNFQLRSPYGDYVSIYQSIIVPLAMILAGSLPRGAGTNSYSQPFLTRVYCKGMFSIPLGLIDSVSIKRGSSEFGWTYANLPTCIDVTVSIKDLSPIMYLTIKNTIGISGIANNLFSMTNSSFNEYMMTLSGLGLFERLSGMSKLRRNFQLSAHKLRNTIFNPLYYGHLIGDSALPKFIGSMVSANMMSHK